jgi:glycosyltransferase involved in cell wall biosynthesis
VQRKNALPSLIWFSQVVGPGRGLETLMTALQSVNFAVELHLLGHCAPTYSDSLKSLFPAGKGHQLFFHAPIPHAALLNELQQHDIGLALEFDTPANKDTTVSNKVLQYVQAGLKTLVTSTKGQLEIANEFPESIQAVSVGDPGQWAKAIEKLISTGPVNREVQLEKFNQLYSWEAQEKKLLSLVEKALSGTAVPENLIAH